jgi:hypothetical protein
MTPYSGNSAYCYSDSLRMCLAQAGLSPLPEVGELECMTGMPFGTTFLRLESPLFFPNAAALNPDTALTHALDILGWGCKLWRGETSEEAETALRLAAQKGPVLLGPVDMGHLKYDPDHQGKSGGDHFVVVLGLAGDTVRLHDPQRYPLVTLPIGELIQAWNASKLGYTEVPYTLRYGFHERIQISQQECKERTLDQATELLCNPPNGPVLYGGANAFSMAAEILTYAPETMDTRMFAAFILPIGARRCLDAATYLLKAKMRQAADMFMQKATLYGEAQYAAVKENWTEVAEYLSKIANIEGVLAHRGIS